ncbi:MAG: glutamate racemase [Porphyromonadaceae bacterium]|nr:MAG: glutamate racemase [Porphyromonadaceae bacterium]
METSAPIGVYDSGIGGLSVWNELRKELSAESMIYVADSANAPYGTKSRSFITGRSREITRFLIDQGCKLIVVACNTATGAAITTLRREFNLPFVGVEPAVKPAAMKSKTGHVGVLATAQTFKGEHFKRSIGLFAHSVELHERAGTGLVELIENGMIDSPETKELLIKYLIPMVEQGIDQLVLGCTHYPFLIPIIQGILPAGIRIIDPAPAVARQTRKVLEEHKGLNSKLSVVGYRFYTTGDPASLSRVLEQLTGSQHLVTKLDGLPTAGSGQSS